MRERESVREIERERGNVVPFNHMQGIASSAFVSAGHPRELQFQV